ncbi:MAG: hypothetical protein NTW00_01805, partial [Hyphomicrobiales bacterium]|nr:hypothetical protein [Hyphomicrobiales bacterium]
MNPDQTTTEQQKTGEERTQAVLAAAPVIAAAAMADVLMIAAPEAGTRKVVDLAGARHLIFGFNLSDVTISIVDVDVVLTFANGSRLILPSFVLSMITTDPPKLAFNGAA